LDHLWQKRLERAAYVAERAGRHYRLLEPENRLVARQLARDWEQKLATQQRLEDEYRRFSQERPNVLSESERRAIRQLAEDIPALWGASTTTNKDRKEKSARFLSGPWSRAKASGSEFASNGRALPLPKTS
jgi:hypothetical protein